MISSLDELEARREILGASGYHGTNYLVGERKAPVLTVKPCRPPENDLFAPTVDRVR